LIYGSNSSKDSGDKLEDTNTSVILNRVKILEETIIAQRKVFEAQLLSLQTLLDIKCKELTDRIDHLVSEISVLNSKDQNATPSVNHPSANSNTGCSESTVSNVCHDLRGASAPSDPTGSAGTTEPPPSGGTIQPQQNEHDTALPTPTDGVPRCIVVGDSIVRDLGSLIKTDNCCVYPRGGDRITRILYRIQNLIVSESSGLSAILLHIGSNDLRRPVNHVLADYKKLLAAVSTLLPNTKIILSAPLYRYDIDHGKIATVATNVSKICTELGVHFLNAADRFKCADNYYDGIHLRYDSKSRLAKEFDTAFTTALGKPSGNFNGVV
jgi:hypothetical protein